MECFYQRCFRKISLFGSLLLLCTFVLHCSSSGKEPCERDRDCQKDQMCARGFCRVKTLSQDDEQKKSDASEERDEDSRNTTEICQLHGDCPSGWKCVDGRCVEPVSPGGCKSNNDCPGKICKEGRCLSGCKGNQDCTGGAICSDGQCTKWCFNDGECTGGYRCVQQKCAVTCSSDSICQKEKGYTCRSGRCLKTFNVCQRDEDCPGTYACKDKRCLTSCTVNIDCKEYHICKGSRCVDSAPCKKNSDCPDGFPCQMPEGRCSSACRSSGACQFNYVCNLKTFKCEGKRCKGNADCTGNLMCKNGTCVDRCRVATDCRANYYCADGKCTPGCRDDTNCSGYTCDKKGRCYTRCFSQKDCKAGLVCYTFAKKCVPPCSKDSDCRSREKCVEKICTRVLGVAKGGEICDPNVGCSSGYACLNIASNGKYYRCLESCRARCWHSSSGCFYAAGATSGAKGCFRKCHRDSDCIYSSSKYKYTCIKGFCQLRLGAPSGNGQDYARCEKHENCAKGYLCMHTDRSGETGAVCLPRCYESGGCPSGFSCRGHNGKKVSSSSLHACYRTCSTEKACPTIPGIRFYCDKYGDDRKEVCQVTN